MLKYSNIVKIVLKLMILSSILFSCDKVSKLSDLNQITEAEIISVSPEGVVLEKPLVNDGTISIPVKVGKYLFPIRIKLQLKSTGNNIKILGIDSEGFIEFRETSSIKVINIVSESGLTKSYDVKLYILPSNEISEITTLLITKNNITGFPVAEDGYANPITSTVNVFTTSPSYPITITPLITISSGAKIIGWNTGDKLTFSLGGETKTLKILSESGREEEWKIKMVDAVNEKLANQEDRDAVIDKLNNPFTIFKAYSTNEVLTIDSIVKSVTNRDIIFYYKGFLPSEGIGIKLEYGLKEYLTTAGIASERIVNFSSNTTVVPLYIVDNVYGIFSTWNIILKPASQMISVEGLSWSNCTSLDAQITPGKPIINTAEKKISIPILSNIKFPLTFEGVEISLLPNISANISSSISFSSFDGTYTFSLKKDGKTEVWRIVLEDRLIPLSKDAEVLDFQIGNCSYSYNICEGYIEPLTSEIILLADKYIDGVPLKIAPKIIISQFAKFENITTGGVIQITPGKPYSFSVLSQNGTKRTWQIKLILAPQIPNGDFEIWGQHPQFSSISSTIHPSDGSGWNSSNNPSSMGVFRSEGNNSQYAATIKTSLSTINFADIIKVTSLASGNLFLGKFRYSTNAVDVYNPSSMTLYGVPFSIMDIPRQLTFVYKYKSGAILVRTSPKTSSATIPAFNPVEELPGIDAGKAFVEFWNDNRELLNAKGELVFDKDKLSWTKAVIEISQTSKTTSPKFISVGFTASRLGEVFTGADGSTLEIDGLRLVYHIPSNKSIKIR